MHKINTQKLKIFISRRIYGLLLLFNLLIKETKSGLIVIPFNIKDISIKENKQFIYTSLEIGDPPKKIDSIIDFENSLFYMLNSENLEINLNNFYIPSKSSSFELISKNISLNNDLVKSLITEKILFCTDLNCEGKNNFDSIPILFPSIDLNESFFAMIDLQTNNKNKTYNIINILKSKKIINNYYWTIKLENISHGKIIIGDLPHNYEKDNYSNKKIYFINTYSDINRIFWGLQFSAVKFNHTTLTNTMQGKIYPKILEIIGSYEYMKAIEKMFFKSYIDNQICRKKIDIVNGEDVHRFICEKNLFNESDKNNFPNLTFINIELNYSFIFKGNELFMEKDEKFYFMIVSKVGKDDGDWLLGRIFLYKYQFVMDNDNNLIGIYKDYKEENKNEKEEYKLIYIFLIALVIILFIILGLTIIFFKKGICKNRKPRISEIDDDFLYESEKGE